MNPIVVEAIRKSRLDNMPRRIKQKVIGIVATFREHAASRGIDGDWYTAEMAPGLWYNNAIKQAVFHLVLRNTIVDSFTDDERLELFHELNGAIIYKVDELVAEVMMSQGPFRSRVTDPVMNTDRMALV
jgi:hypothetical protein